MPEDFIGDKCFPKKIVHRILLPNDLQREVSIYIGKKCCGNNDLRKIRCRNLSPNHFTKDFGVIVVISAEDQDKAVTARISDEEPIAEVDFPLPGRFPEVEHEVVFHSVAIRDGRRDAETDVLLGHIDGVSEKRDGVKARFYLVKGFKVDNLSGSGHSWFLEYLFEEKNVNVICFENILQFIKKYTKIITNKKRKFY
jgi:hypothetical protein